MAVIILKIIFGAITMLSNLVFSLLFHATTCFIVMAIKALKFPGVALQFAVKHIGCLIRHCFEDVVVFVLKFISKAISLIVCLFYTLVVEVLSRLAATTKAAAGWLVQKLTSELMELILFSLKGILKSISRIDNLFFNLGVDFVSRLEDAIAAGGELVEKLMLAFDGLTELVVFILKAISKINDNLFFNLVVEVYRLVDGVMVAAGELVADITSAFDGFLKQWESAAEIVRDYVEYLWRYSPVILDMTSKIVDLLYERVMEVVVDSVKDYVFGWLGTMHVIDDWIKEAAKSAVKKVIRIVTDLWNN